LRNISAFSESFFVQYVAAEGKNVIVSWREKNQTSMVPVAKVSTDYGHTFGPRLNITANPFGTIGRTEGK